MSTAIETTPISKNIATVYSESLSGAPDVFEPISQYRAKVLEDMAHRAVRLNKKQFVDTFLCIPDDIDVSQHPRPVIHQNPFIKLQGANSDQMIEAEIFERLAEAINKNKLAGGLLMSLSESCPDPVAIDPSGQKIDAALYHEKVVPKDGCPHWPDQVIPIEFKRHGTDRDAFDDKKEEVQAMSVERKKVQGQLISYAEITFAVQQRVFLIMVFVFGRKLRLLRWDRSGVIVTQAVDYYNNWKWFCDALWRISVLARLAPHRLRADPSATRIYNNDDRWATMTRVAKAVKTDVGHDEHVLEPNELTGPHTFAYVRKLFRLSLVDGWPRYQLEVPDGNKMRNFLVCRPYFRAKGMAGRGTRGYVAFDCDSERFVWLKDAWRAHYDLVEREGDVLRRLNAAKVENIPTLVCHGDILGQTTETPDHWLSQHPKPPVPVPPVPAFPVASTSKEAEQQTSSNSFKRKHVDDDGNDNAKDVPRPNGVGDGNDNEVFRPDCPLRRHKHYRIVVEEVCMDLLQFKNGQQLVSIVYDAVIAHYLATKEDVLHRDISGGNILIYPRVICTADGSRWLWWKGVLTDWELSKGITATKQPRQPERTGTWQYMSVALLTEISKVVEIPDDLESFFYVILYHAVRYLKSNCIDIPIWLEEFFDCFTVEEDTYLCGDKKKTAIEIGKLPPGSAKSKTPLHFSTAMDNVISILLRCFHAHNAVTKYDAEEKAILPSTVAKLAAPKTTPKNATAAPRALLAAPLPFVKAKRAKPALARATNVTPKRTPPSAEEREDASAACDHELFLELLLGFINDDAWEDDDKRAEDGVPQGWMSTKKLGPSRAGSALGAGASSKRRKVHGFASISGAMEHVERERGDRETTPSKKPSAGVRKSARIASRKTTQRTTSSRKRGV
ncbi:hypothetical protein C8Q80DRAFT_1200609 [Daedaleopsis nitida]|nr:hypothetical protein C8Q80DRAFT_1200609 [Daedaleopsis nitida]